MGLEREKMDAVTPSGMTFAEFIGRMAAAAKLNIQQKGPDLIVVPWNMEEGRKQKTYVRPLGTLGNGDMIVGFFSPCKRVTNDADLPYALVLDLIRKNSRLAVGARGAASNPARSTWACARPTSRRP